MNLLALVFSTGWASGVNAYLVVLVLGVADRVATLPQVPDAFGRTDVLVGAAVLYGIEFVADKVPWLDSVWDVVSTVVRPTVAAVIGALVAGQDPEANQVLYALLSAVTALASHSVKAGGRLAINASPEPVTNIGASLGEDVSVLGVTVLAVQHPVLAGSIALLLLVVGGAVVLLLIKHVRRGWRRRAARRSNERVL